jgi:probable phosphoglycerate mutase
LKFLNGGTPDMCHAAAMGWEKKRMAKIYLIRHCESEGNACRRTQAQTDALVTAKGYEQCEMLRRRFHDIPIDAVYSSDSFRSIATAEPIAKEHGVPVHVRISLREVTTGIWEDMAWGNIADEYPKANKVWNEEPWNCITPGASTFQQAAERLAFCLRTIAGEIGETGTALAISHSCTIKSGLCLMMGKPMTCVKEMTHSDNTAVSEINVDADGNISVAFVNDASHLPESLRRAWSGVAGPDVNMSVYPIKMAEQSALLVQMARALYSDRGGRAEEFCERDYLTSCTAALERDPRSIALCYLRGKPTGFVRMGTDEMLPRGCGVVEEMYVLPELQGKGYCEQLLGYAMHEMRYGGLSEIAVRKGGSAEERRATGRFLFEQAKGHPDYCTLQLRCPPCAYPILA